MKTNIFIPQTIRVGFQNRDDTYTKKLAYVIYIDQKGKVRKEASWNNWRDKKIDPIDYPNEPTSGFVLNKKVGDYVAYWNHRQAYVRVYDPRGFEFEITIPNLLYILENTNSIKGKGLEGDFVYGWDGAELVLIPTSSPDYMEIFQFNKILHENNYVKAKNLVLGATYRAKDNTEWVYMGRYDYHVVENERIEDTSQRSYWGSHKYIKKNVNKGKHYYFVREVTNNWSKEKYLQVLTLKSLGDKFIGVVSSDCADNYADLFDQLERRTEYSPHDETKDEYKNYTFEEFQEYINGLNLQDKHKYYQRIILQIDKGDKKEINYDAKTNLFYLNGAYNRQIMEYEKEYIGTIEDVFAKYQPVYKNEYLQNGKLYRRIN